MSIFLYFRKEIYKYGFLWVLVSFMSACIFEDEPVIPTENAVSGAYLKIQLDLPEMSVPSSNEAGTRAMSPEAERIIDLNSLHILVFKSTGEFYYKAPVVGSIVYDDGDLSKATLTVKLVKSENVAEKFKIGIVTNYDMSAFPLTNTTTVDDVKQALTYALPGKWNVDDQNYTPFPMWGETGELIISETMAMPTIDLYRALARIDVGLNFSDAGGILSESADGVSGFKLKQVYVYRTNKSGFVAHQTIGQIHIPAGVERHGDNDPLQYSVSAPEGGDSYVREIYIPETELPSSPGNSNMHSLVVGGYYQGSGAVSYYRLDFATENRSTGVRTYLPIVRNHRYVFNINTVRGPGFGTPEEALESVATIENIDYDLIEFDESIHQLEVHGKYYFGLDKRNLQFAPQPTVTEPINSFKIKYQTNYPLSTSDPLTLNWGKGNPSSLFNAVWDESTQEITITALTENVTNFVQFDTLFVKAGPITIPVRVEQLYVNFKYYINCESVTVSGLYKSGTVLNATHYIDLSFTAEDRSIQGKTYVFETVDLEGNHGISFSASGVFNFSSIPVGNPLTVNVRLYGTGTLNYSNSEGPFKLRIKSNSSSGSYCEATISPVNRKMKILVLGNQDLYGYNIALPNTGANKILTSTNNFGPYDHSIVKTEGFELINARLNTSAPNTSPGIGQMRSWLIDGPDIVDILYITQDVYVYSTETNTDLALLAKYIAQFINNNGVVLVFNEGNGANAPYTAANIVNACMGITTITQIQQGPSGLVYQLAGDPEVAGDPYFADPIMNGPFGDVRKKQWGEDASYCAILANVPTDEIILYSNGMPINGSGFQADRVNMVSGFRHKTKNLVYFGDGGFTSSGTNGQPYIVPNGTICPLNWDTSTMFPIPYPSYGSYLAQMAVYNSQVWCNVMAWAIDRAANHGINTR